VSDTSPTAGPGEPERLADEIHVLRESIDRANEQLRAQAEELGRLRAGAERARGLQEERDRLFAELTEARAALANRVAQEVRAALEDLRAEHAAAAARWQEERQALQAELDRAREAAAPQAVEGKEIPTDKLALGLRAVFERVAVPEPTPGKEFAAALTGFEVDARGVLLPPEQEGQPTRLRTVDPASVPSEALSTVKMRFGLLPRLPTEAPPRPPEG
jgi:hypothetical protein